MLENEKYMSVSDTIQFLEDLTENAFIPEIIARKLDAVAMCIKYIDYGVYAFGEDPAEIAKLFIAYRAPDENDSEEYKKEYMKNKVECEEIWNRVRIDNVLEEEEDEEEC